MEDIKPVSLHARTFDEFNQHWSSTGSYNQLFIRAQESWLNDVLRARGHVFLNEAYDALGFERSQAGATQGWYSKPGSNAVEFKLTPFPDGSIVIDFNVDGEILKYLP